MPSHPRLADLAVKEALEAHDAALALAAEIQQAAGDGAITSEELRRIVAASRRVQRETQEVVEAAERNNVGELIAASFLTATPLNPNVARKAAEVGLQPAAFVVQTR